MNAPGCYSDADLGTLAALPAGDPRLAHLAVCPRCRSRLALYREFLEPSALPGGARADEADARLAAVLEREILAATRPAPARTRGENWLARWLAPARRPVWALAAIAVVAAGVWAIARGPSRPLMRGPETGTGVEVRAPVESAGAVTLAWRPVRGADRYEVRFYATDLSDLARLPAPAGDRLELRRGTLPPPLSSGERVLWQVVALHGGDVLARSRTRSLRLP